MNIFGDITQVQFLAEYWQKKPLLIRNAFPNFESPIEPDELAGLALEEEVEARLILENGANGKWELQNGPFTEETFQSLPAEKWSLLVQAADQWVPEVNQLLANFNFIPSWRLDDLMISFAPKGGSVGPHYDNYDVFLIQAHGQRHWQVGPKCSDKTAIRKDTQLRILEEMEVTDEWTLNPGDMLYLPPLYAHNGVAQNDCMTFSVGFRAPSEANILQGFTDHIIEHLTEDARYTDANLSDASIQTALIDDASIERLKAIINKHLNNEAALKSWFAQYMTESKYPDLHDALEEPLEWKDIESFFNESSLLCQNETTRWAYFKEDGTTKLFVNAEQVPLNNSTKNQQLAEILANSPILDTNELGEFSTLVECQNLLLLLINNNYLYFDEA